MTTLDLENEKYRLIGGAINPKSHRNVKSMLLLSKNNMRFVAWSFDGKHYTIPKIVDTKAATKCLKRNAGKHYDNAANVPTGSNAISAYC